MWHSTIHGSHARFNCTGNNCSYFDFAILGETVTRDDESPENGFNGGAGLGSRLENIWVEHTKVGYWVGGYSQGLAITGSRFRNLFADGVNFCNETFDYTLTYYAGESGHTVTITDNVPAGTTVLSATGSKSPNPTVNGQDVSWTVSVGSGEAVTLTIEAQAAAAGLVENTAVFAGQETLQASTQVFVYTYQVYLPIITR